MEKPDFAAIRQGYSGLKKKTYLQSAGLGLLPDSSVELARSLAERYALPVEEHLDTVFVTPLRIKRLLGKILNGEAENLTFCHGTSQGLNMLVSAIDWREGDEILLPGGEFPANHYAWANMERHGVKVRVLDEAHWLDEVELIEQALTEKTRVLALSHVSFSDGRRRPLKALKEICERTGTWLVADMAQSAGCVPIDLSHVHAAAGNGHKWLCGGLATGFLYTSPEVRTALKPRMMGWLNMPQHQRALNLDDLRIDPASDGSMLELGNFNELTLELFRRQLEYTLEIGPVNIWERDLQLHRRLIDGLQEIGAVVASPTEGDWMSGILTFSVPGVAPDSLFEYLVERGFVPALRVGVLRVSPHYYNSEEDIDSFVRAVAEYPDYSAARASRVKG